MSNPSRSKGSTLVELAFLIPILFALVFGIIDFWPRTL